MRDKWAPVSVVIPCYNCEKTIERAVNSVARQTWKPREIILVDDASAEDCLSRLYEIEKRHQNNWIKVIQRSENGGAGATRNTGWEKAKQPYIAFLDADDTWHVRKIEVQVSYMEAHPEVALTGHRIRWESTPQQRLDSLLPEDLRVREIGRWRMLLSNMLWTSTIMLRRELPFRFESTKRFSEDYLLWLMILLEGYGCRFMDVELAYYYKKPFGEQGLTRKLWTMEKNELDTFRRIWRMGLISLGSFMIVVPISLVKFVRRVFLREFAKFRLNE